MASITGDNVAGYTNVLSATNCIIANNGPVGLNAYDGGKSNFAFGIDYNIVYGQTTNYAGLATNALHSNDLNVNPKFIGGGNYKLQGASLAADSGINIGVSNDLVNVVRPLGAGFDRGCYEGKRVASGTTAFFR